MREPREHVAKMLGLYRKDRLEKGSKAQRIGRFRVGVRRAERSQGSVTGA